VFLQDADSADAKAYEKAAETTDDIPFAITSDDAIFSKYDVSKDSVVLFKKVSSRSEFTLSTARRRLPHGVLAPLCLEEPRPSGL